MIGKKAYNIATGYTFGFAPYIPALTGLLSGLVSAVIFINFAALLKNKK